MYILWAMTINQFSNAILLDECANGCEGQRKKPSLWGCKGFDVK